MALPSLSDRVGGVVKLWNMDCRIVFSFKNSSNNLYYGTPLTAGHNYDLVGSF